MKSYLLKIRNIVLISCGVVLFACNNASKVENTAIQDTGPGKLDQETAVSDQDSIILELKDGYAEQQAMMKKGRHVVFVFDTEMLAELKAHVQANAADGNVRIAQIVAPDDAADGPFGQQLTYDLKQAGRYRLVISENQMAGNPYYGPFTIHIKVTPR